VQIIGLRSDSAAYIRELQLLEFIGVVECTFVLCDVTELEYV
jgi:hypothetical protein